MAKRIFGIILAQLGVEMKIEKAHFDPIAYGIPSNFYDYLVQFFFGRLPVLSYY